MCLGDFTSRKTRLNANPCAIYDRSETNQTYIFSMDASSSLVFYRMPDQESSWSYLCTKTQQIACPVITQAGWSLCPPKQSHKYARLVWVRGYHSFPKWAIVEGLLSPKVPFTLVPKPHYSARTMRFGSLVLVNYNFYGCNLQVWLLFSFSKTMATIGYRQFPWQTDC